MKMKKMRTISGKIIKERLLHIAGLKKNWFSGMGETFDSDKIKKLINIIRRVNIPLPDYLYPYLDGEHICFLWNEKLRLVISIKKMCMYVMIKDDIKQIENITTNKIKEVIQSIT